MKQILITITFIILLGCGTSKTISHPSEEIKQNSFYYEGDSVSFKVDSITGVYNLPPLPHYKDWLEISYIGIHKKDSVYIKTYYILLEKGSKTYIFNVLDIEEVNFKQFKFKIN